jgi:DNA gyrase subunit B
MPQILEKGYLYIAQPPLFKVKKGKTEKYIQDDKEMQNLLFELASDDMEIQRKGQAVKGKALIPYLKKLYRYERLISWFERRRRDPDLLVFLLSLDINKETLKDRKKLEEIIGKIREKNQGVHIGEVQFDEEHQAYSVEVRRHNYKVILDTNFLTSPEFRELVNLYTVVQDLGKSPYKVQVKSELKEIENNRELLELIMTTAKKGLSIQRYKGLGEMNPQQLWETTMDSEKRTLLQVAIQDSIQSDEIFTILMGDQVEPRKEFITTHALEARNIDI